MSAADVAETLNVSLRTAYTYMGEMIHLERPLRVTEGNLKLWIAQHTVDPEAPKRPKISARHRPRPEGYRIPRRR